MMHEISLPPAAAPDLGNSGLRPLAQRLTPNPAISVEGTLAIILDGIDKLDEEKLARALGYISAREQGLDVQPMTDIEWEAADLDVKLQLAYSARALKIALRTMSHI